MEIDYDWVMKWNDRLRQARDAAGISNSDIAKACGVAPASVTDWMNGETKRIEAHNLLPACKLLKVSPFWVMLGDEDPGTTFEALPEGSKVETMDILRLIALFAQSSEEGQKRIIDSADQAARLFPRH